MAPDLDETMWCWHDLPLANRRRLAVLLGRLALRRLPLRIPGEGVEGEALRPLDLSPCPNSRSRTLVGEGHIQAHLDAVQEQQLEDGGWMFDWLAWSPEQTSAWRGIVTIRALTWLRDNGRPV